MKKNFVDIINEVMKEKNINQSELSRKTGITQSTISDWVRGKYLPRQDKIDVLAKALDVQPAYLMGFIDNEPYSLNRRDIKEIDEYMEQVERDLTNASMMFDGEPMDEESLQLVLNSMRVGIEMAKKRNKEKYTPKKYRK
ncbi:helix-turn-helix domain-containing protein [Peptoanaerobacter stomatis]|uniref:helix-turn-helix domain-containing protein n=1 Tax=Peptoanaerobacter stomatis TaxID=796937 RepID=UPI003FA18420